MLVCLKVVIYLHFIKQLTACVQPPDRPTYLIAQTKPSNKTFQKPLFLCYLGRSHNLKINLRHAHMSTFLPSPKRHEIEFLLSNRKAIWNHPPVCQSLILDLSCRAPRGIHGKRLCLEMLRFYCIVLIIVCLVLIRLKRTVTRCFKAFPLEVTSFTWWFFSVDKL